MEPHRPQPGASYGSLEPLLHLRRVEHGAEERVCEDEIVVARKARLLKVPFELPTKRICERNSTAGAARLRRAELAAGVAAPDTNHALGPVDVAPPQREQFAGLKRLYDTEIPLDIFQLIVARATSRGTDPLDPCVSATNGERGANTHALAILVSRDKTGRLARELEPHVDALVNTENTALRTTVAEALRALFPWHPERAVHGFLALVATGDAQLFMTRQFEELSAAVIMRDVTAALPLIRHLLEHEDDDARERGSRLATYAATDAGQDALLAEVVSSSDVAVRRGAAAVLADRARWVTEPTVHANLIQLFSDSDETVRSAAARVVMRLRDADLTKYDDLLQAFVDSPGLNGGIAQLAITLRGAPGEIVSITLALAHRFLDMFENDIRDIRTHAAGDARQIGELVLRAYAQAQTGTTRSEVLDIVDRLLALNAYGFADAVEEVARPSYH